MNLTFSSLKEAISVVTNETEKEDAFLIIGGFQAHKQFTVIPIRPLTVLLGPNSVGKTSILRAFSALRSFYENGLEDFRRDLGGRRALGDQAVIGISIYSSNLDLDVEYPDQVDSEYISRIAASPGNEEQFDSNPRNLEMRDFRERVTVIFEVRKLARKKKDTLATTLTATVLIKDRPLMIFSGEWEDDDWPLSRVLDARISVSYDCVDEILHAPHAKRKTSASEFLNGCFLEVSDRVGKHLECDMNPSWRSATSSVVNAKEKPIKSFGLVFKPLDRNAHYWKLGPPKIGCPSSWLGDMVEVKWDFDDGVDIYYFVAQFLCRPVQIFLKTVPTNGNRPIRSSDPSLAFEQSALGVSACDAQVDEYLLSIASVWFAKLRKEKLKKALSNEENKLAERYDVLREVFQDKALFGSRLDFGIAYRKKSTKTVLMGVESADSASLWERQEGDTIKMQLLVDGEPRQFSEVGSGIAQLLPVVVAALSPSAESIQQPELHLHPALHGRVADVVITGVRRMRAGHKAIFVETHSEHFVLRVLRRVIHSGNGPRTMPWLDEDEIALIFMEKSASGTVSHLIEVGPDGNFLAPWPNGFFEERLEDLKALFEASAANDSIR